MNNVIARDEDLLGFFEDLREYTEGMLKEVIDKHNYEDLDLLIETLKELEQHKEYGGILVISNNNGMGLTVREYTGE